MTLEDKEGGMKHIFILVVLFVMITVLGCEKKTVIDTPAGKISVTQPR